MPYIKEELRKELDSCINELIICLRSTVRDKVFEQESLSDQELLEITGNINYTVSRLCASLMGKISYSKIAIITGVLENIKQEFYRRASSPYEDRKINENGDIREYKLLK